MIHVGYHVDGGGGGAEPPSPPQRLTIKLRTAALGVVVPSESSASGGIYISSLFLFAEYEGSPPPLIEPLAPPPLPSPCHHYRFSTETL